MRLLRRAVAGDFPRPVWMIAFVVVLSMSANSMFWPFISLWVTRELAASPTQAGAILLAGAAVGIIGSVLGGWLADRVGRRPLVIVTSGLGAARMAGLAFANSLPPAVVLLLVGDLVINAWEPGIGALIADLMPPERLIEGYGLRRAAGSAGWMIGPALGGLAASRSWDFLFVCSAAGLGLATVLAALVLPHGQSVAARASAHRPSPWTAIRDLKFLAFVGAITVIMTLLGWYESVVPLYLQDVRGIGPGTWGLILIVPSTLIVLMQLRVSRYVQRISFTRAGLIGAAGFGAGVAGLGLPVPALALTIPAALVAIGIMFVLPLGSSVAGRIAPLALRGAYQGAVGLTISIAFGIGPLAGLTLYQRLGHASPFVAAPFVALLGGLLLVVTMRPFSER